MEAIIWILVFGVSITALVKGADWLLEGAEKVGKYFSLPPFVIGALIVGIGTSFPEFASGVAAIFAGDASIVPANAVGSNVANILLVAGLAAVVGKKIASTKDILDIEMPLLVLSTCLFLGLAYDGSIVFIESMLLVLAFGVYLTYLLTHSDQPKVKKKRGAKISQHDWMLLLAGSGLLGVGAHFLIQAVINLSAIYGINSGVIAISAVAIGTSLPEILVSVTAVLRGKTDLAFGNVFGSNVFNLLMMVGILGLFSDFTLDEQTLTIGLPFLAVVTFLFLVSSLSRRIYLWEGLMFLIFYLFFLLKIFNLI